MTARDFRATLDRLGLSQVEAARIFGLTDRQMRRYASGDSDIPRAIEIALRLAEKFDVSLRDL